jgi:hypothetical protein
MSEYCDERQQSERDEVRRALLINLHETLFIFSPYGNELKSSGIPIKNAVESEMFVFDKLLYRNRHDFIFHWKSHSIFDDDENMHFKIKITKLNKYLIVFIWLWKTTDPPDAILKMW